MRVLISSHADTRIRQRLNPLLASRAHAWVQQQVADGRLASRSPNWHGRKRVSDPARRFVRAKLDGRGVLIVVERVARDILRVITVIVQGVTTPAAPRLLRLTDRPIGRPITGTWPPATACYMPIAA